MYPTGYIYIYNLSKGKTKDKTRQENVIILKYIHINNTRIYFTLIPKKLSTFSSIL